MPLETLPPHVRTPTLPLLEGSPGDTPTLVFPLPQALLAPCLPGQETLKALSILLDPSPEPPVYSLHSAQHLIDVGLHLFGL